MPEKEKKRKTHNSLAQKYVVLCLMVVFAGLVIFGGILLAFSKEYFDKQAWQTLYEDALTAANYTYENTTKTDEGYVPNMTRIQEGYRILTNQPGHNLFLTNTNGRILVFISEKTSLENGLPVKDAIPEEIMAAVKTTGQYLSYGTIDGLYQSDHHIAIVPLYAGTNSTEIIGYIAAAASGKDLHQYLVRVLEIFVLGAIAVLAFTFTMMSIGTDKFMQPLKEMSEVTVSYSKGDFSKRVPINPNSFDEMNQLVVAFNNMASALAAHEQSSRNFVANISHELKTPMTTIGGFIDGILDGTISPQEERHYLSIVSSEVKRLSRMVVSMLNLSRIEAGETTLHPVNFDISETVIQILFTFERRISEKQLDVLGLDIEEKQMVYADPDMMHQVIYNLVDNAVKFANEGGYLEFRYTQKDGMLYLSIKNSGQGISKEEIRQVFDRFYKTDKSRSLDKSGVGLGLYIVKSIMNMHNGDISVSSVEGEYCEFTISLPIANPKNKLPQ